MDKKFKVGLIRVLTTEDEEVLSAHGKQIMSYGRNCSASDIISG